MSAHGSVLSLAAGRAWPARIERLEGVLRRTGVRLDAAAPRLGVLQAGGLQAGTRRERYPRLRLLP